ncbi:host cell division inhibitor Icd-like protein [Enterobacter mori]|uniref:Host cell division inhibitor Icd-like protein n=3 Tax=Enterobacterales TaxID=91347 RepID=A0A9Q7JZ56_9ENTR|nr:host cell division inhibitor Icd-like protein [Enterobacter mori]MCC8238392.1 host cell division inhibitor Icd-like protein [Enterobacter mori]RTQ20859.1 host cell division inhibitor Icd-like protein [Enterobacter mori]
MADLQHTQTRPEFTWRFLSASERYPNAKPLVIYLNASSEQEARDSMPGVNLIFAARLPFHAFQAMEYAMRELTNKSASIACELAALLMVVEECDVDQVERENLISLARRVSDQLAASMVEQNSTGALNG